MKSLGMWITPHGTKLSLRITPDADVLALVVFLNRYTGGGKVTDLVWSPSELAAGVSRILEFGTGYDVNIKAQISKTSSIDVTLELNGTQMFNEAVSLPIKEGAVVSRELSVVLS